MNTLVLRRVPKRQRAGAISLTLTASTRVEDIATNDESTCGWGQNLIIEIERPTEVSPSLKEVYTQKQIWPDERDT